MCNKSDYLQYIWDCVSMLHLFYRVFIHRDPSNYLGKVSLS